MATHLASPAHHTRSTTGVRRWAWATLACFVIVVLWGAVVRATSSGAGCGQHWPLCNGDFVPHHPRLATIIEFTHRASTGFSTALFAVMIAWTFYATPRRHPARRAAAVSGLLLVTEALLGAVLVLRHLVENTVSVERDLMQSIHFTNTMLLLAAVTLTVYFLGKQQARTSERDGSRTLAWCVLLAILVTGATGALAALADTLFPFRTLHEAFAADFAAQSPLLIRMRWLHPVASAVVTAATAAWAWRLRCNGRGGAALLLVANLAAQVLLGTVDILLLTPTWIQVLHLLSADIFWISAVIIAAPALFPARK